jgi:hypothetical protein
MKKFKIAVRYSKRQEAVCCEEIFEKAPGN